MSSSSKRYNGYHLVNNNDMDDVEFQVVPKKGSKRCICISVTLFLILTIVILLITFVVFPIVFMYSKTIQTALIFTRFNLPKEHKIFQDTYFPAYRNIYLNFNATQVTLGVWQILPVTYGYNQIFGEGIDFDQALLNSNYSVLIYFHGTGEARSDNLRKYDLFSHYFHVITFDYRGYGDSSKGEISEDKVIEDCVELYKWVRNKTNSDIYVWGHSLGAALATRTVAVLQNSHQINTTGLILESAFTNLRDELYVHPYGKIFAWLPWFEKTILIPLEKNGFIFDTEKHLANISSPVMILHAQDDHVIPYQFGRKLFSVALARNITSLYYEFKADLDYEHNYIYQDPFLKYDIMNFQRIINITNGR